MKYMLTIYGNEGAWEHATPEQMKAAMEPWSEYGRALADAGAFIAGEGLQPSATATTVNVSESGDRSVTDGPFAETKEQLGGFYLIECADLDEALEWAKKVPVSPPGSVELRPAMNYAEFGYEDPSATVEAAS